MSPRTPMAGPPGPPAAAQPRPAAEAPTRPARADALSPVAASAALEQVLAPTALAHPAARAATRAVLRRLVDLLAATGESDALDLATLLGAAPPHSARAARHAAVQMGDVAPEDVAEAIAGDDVRAQVSMFRRAEHRVAVLLYRLAGAAESTPSAKDALRRLGLDPALLAARYREVRATYGDDPAAMFSPPADSPVFEIPDMRRAPAPGEPTSGRLWTDGPEALGLAAPARRYLDAVGARLLAHGVAVPTRQGADGQLAYALPESVGTLRFRPNAEHPWHREARALGMFTRVSISGTTYRLMWMARLIGLAPARLGGLAQALLGHMVPRHHTFHEVMSAAAEHGVPYTPGLAAMRATARELALGPAAAPPATFESLDALVLGRIAAHADLADLPRLRLVNRALRHAVEGPDGAPGPQRAIARALMSARSAAGLVDLASSPWAQRLMAHAGGLRVSDRGLTDADVAQLAARLPTLRAITLDDNPLATVPWALLAHTELTSLSLRRTSARLPAPPPGAPVAALAHLSLTQAPERALAAGAPWLFGLTSLSLLDAGLDAVPPSLVGLPRLERLVLDDNRLGTLPAWLGELPALVHLTARRAGVRHVDLAREPGQAPRLERLALSFNAELTAWPLGAGAAPRCAAPQPAGARGHRRAAAPARRAPRGPPGHHLRGRGAQPDGGPRRIVPGEKADRPPRPTRPISSPWPWPWPGPGPPARAAPRLAYADGSAGRAAEPSWAARRVR